MAVEWFYRNNSGDFGPVSSASLKALAQTGDVGPDTLVRQGAAGDWVAAKEVRGLFPPTPPPMPASGPCPLRAATGRATMRDRLRACWRRMAGALTWTIRGLRARLVPVLLGAALLMLAMSVLLQAVTCWAILRLTAETGHTRGPRAGERAMLVKVVNTVPVEVQNSRLDVRLYDHYILSGDPIPVEIVK